MINVGACVFFMNIYGIYGSLKEQQDNIFADILSDLSLKCMLPSPNKGDECNAIVVFQQLTSTCLSKVFL